MTAHASETASAASADAASAAPRSHVKRLLSFREPGTEHYSFRRHLTIWDAPIYCVILALLAPLVASVVPELQMRERIYGVVLIIILPSYWWVETEEIMSQIKATGLLDPDRLQYQRYTMLLPIAGFIIGAGINMLAGAGHWQDPAYTWREWFFLTIGLINAIAVIGQLWPYLDYYNLATGSKQHFYQPGQH